MGRTQYHSIPKTLWNYVPLHSSYLEWPWSALLEYALQLLRFARDSLEFTPPFVDEDFGRAITCASGLYLYLHHHGVFLAHAQSPQPSRPLTHNLTPHIDRTMATNITFHAGAKLVV